MSRRAPHRTVQAADPDRNGRRKRSWRRRRDWGGILAKLFCVAFALVGLLPLTAGALIRLDVVQQWAADRTAQLIESQLAVVASYDLELQPWPLMVSIDNLEVPASDGGGPFLVARHVTARPRIFSLLAGKLDLGAIEVVEPRVRAVVREGALQNLDYDLPDGGSDDTRAGELPLSSAAITNGRFDVTIDGLQIRTEQIDLDVSLRRSRADEPLLPTGQALDVALRAGPTDIDHRHASPAFADWEMMDEDALCGLELRASLDDHIVVRRLELDGALDLDPGVDTRPPCDVDDADWRKVSLSLESVALRLGKGGGPETVDGRLKVRVPVPVVHRFVDVAPTTGWVELSLEQIHFGPERRLPEARGTLRAARIGIDSKIIGRYVKADLAVVRDQLEVSDVQIGWAAGEFRVAEVKIAPFADGIPLQAKDVRAEGVTLQAMLDDLGVHPRAHVGWNLAQAVVPKFGGTLDPIALSGPMTADTNEFNVYDRPTDAPDKRTFLRVAQGRLAGEFRVGPDAIVLNGFTADTGKSNVQATVTLGYENSLGIKVFEGSYVDLTDISPLVDIPMEGKAKIDLEGYGPNDNPAFDGHVAVEGFRFAGFPIGDISQAKVRFIPLELELRDALVEKGQSRMSVPRFNLNFSDGDANVVLDTEVDTRSGQLRLSDFFAMTQLVPEEAQDGTPIKPFNPTWKEMDGYLRGRASAHYVLGGRRDRCGTGELRVQARMGIRDLRLFGLEYDGGRVDVDFLWDDIEASDKGMVVDVHSGVLRKGDGTIVAKAALRHGAKLRADVVGTAIPLRELQAFRDAFDLIETDESETVRRVAPEAKLSFVAAVRGSLDKLKADADIDISQMRIGPDVLPPSRLTFEMIPNATPPRVIGRTGCGNDITPGFDPGRYAADTSSGIYQLRGSLFEGQVQVDDLQITQQRKSLASGRVTMTKMDLGALANLVPGIAFSSEAPKGWLSAEVTVDELPLDTPGFAEVRIRLDGAEFARSGTTLTIPAVEQPLLLSGDALRVPVVPLKVRFPSGLKAQLTSQGTISDLSQTPSLNLGLRLAPTDLATLGVDLPQVSRAAGRLEAALEVRGTLDEPRLVGRLGLENGMVRVDGLPIGLDDIEVDLDIRGNEIRIRRASARAGNTGRMALSGRIPLKGLDINGGDTVLVVTDLKVPVADGVKLTADARLRITLPPASAIDKRALPSITGRVTLKQFSYTRPISFRLDLDSITGRGATDVETYDPAEDLFDFDVLVVSPQPVRISNNLLEIRMNVENPGLRVAGTDQRFGAQGELTLQPGSKLFLQGHDFTVRDGTITFESATRIAPRLDVHATTVYRRYATVSDDTSAVTPGTAGGTVGGRWRITMHAFGDTDAPEVRFTSDPPLSQEDIVLLLQIGMTRAELDRGLLGSLAQTVGLEALSAVVGLDEAVRTTVPLIDEFRVGSQYSSRTGRPEPTLTLGKRISDQLRATVTTTLGEEREIRSNIEYRFKSGVSLQGGYDNVNDVSSSVLGNVGAGLRWRLEFE